MDNWDTITGEPLEALAWLRAIHTDGRAVIIHDHERRVWMVSLPYAGRRPALIEAPLLAPSLERPRSTWTAAVGPCGAANVADELERFGLGRDAQEAGR